MIEWGLTVVLALSLMLNVLLIVLMGRMHKFNDAVDGQMVIEETDDRLIYHMELNDDPEYTLEGKTSVTFEVVRTQG